MYISMEEKMSRKFWSLISLVLVAALLLTACGTPAAQTTPEPTQPTVAQPVNIRVWHQWQGAYLAAIEQVFRDYEASHEGVTITLESPENVQDALRVAIPAGEGPDIIGWAVDNIGQQALVGNIVPLNNLGVDMAFLESNFEPAAVNGVVWQDQIWGLPESQEGIALVYNRALASEADFPANPSDFQDLLAKATAFRQANPDKYLVCNQGLGNPDAYHVGAIYFGHGVPEYVDDQGNVFINSPEALAAGEWMTQFREVAPSETSHEICRTMLQEGQAAAWWTGPWAIADLEAEGMDYGILPMGSPFVGVKTLMISKNAVDRGNAEVALDIIRFFTNAENSKAIALANKTIPANTAALNDSEVAALATISGFGASLNLGVPMANTPFAGAQWGPVGDATTAIWNGSQTPAEALQAAQEAMEQAIAEMQ
jgi:arabinogalactan oligomer / maltooligosaccharide transport system substrate-binding protein